MLFVPYPFTVLPGISRAVPVTLLYATTWRNALLISRHPATRLSSCVHVALQDMVRMLVLNLHRPCEEPAAGGASDEREIHGSAAAVSASAASAQHQQYQSPPLPWECCQDIIALAAYPVSIWL